MSQSDTLISLTCNTQVCCVVTCTSVGLTCEGIYRISGVKSKVQALKDAYNRSHPVYLHEHEPNVIASLLKQFFRDLPEPVLTARLMPKFEQASSEFQLPSC